MEKEKGYFKYPTGYAALINCTGKTLELIFDNSIIKVETSKYTLPAIKEERVSFILNGVDFINYGYLQTKNGKEEIKRIREIYGKYTVIVGNANSAKAYSCDVVTPVDFEENFYGIKCNPFVFKVYGNSIFFSKAGANEV